MAELQELAEFVDRSEIRPGRLEEVKTAVETNSLVKSLVFLRTGIGGPKVAPATVAATGEQPWIPVVGGGLLLGAMVLWRGRRRLHAVRVKQ